jgi:tRNA dimethylallyltransferase
MQAALDTLSFDELRRWCEALDPARAHLGRAQLTRAIEVALLTGRPISEWHASAARPPRYRARYLVVDPGAVLREWIAARAAAMLDAGWLHEVRHLLETVPDDAPAWNATGYETVAELARGRLSRVEALERIVIATRQYAKRQRTWFRNQLANDDVTTIDPRAPDALDRAMTWLKADDCTLTTDD